MPEIPQQETVADPLPPESQERDKAATRLTVMLAEFNALREEIKDRSSTAYTLLNINITATAAIAGFVISEEADATLLLILPLLSPALGMVFVDHAFNITNLGNYINERLRPLACEATGDPRLLAYEAFVREYEKNVLLRFLPLIFPLTLLFGGFPIAALWLSYPSLAKAWEWFLWSAGVIMVLAFLYLWMTFFFAPYKGKKNADK